MERRHVSLVGPTILIGLGIILLLNNLGYLDWGFWDVLRLWPILLIAAGLEFLVGRRSIWASVAAALLLLVLLVGGVWLADSYGPRRGGGEPVEISYPLEGADAATIELEPAIADVTLGALDDSADLVAGTVHTRAGEELDRRFRDGTRPRVTLGAGDIGPRAFGGLVGSTAWELRANPDVDLDLRFDLGVGSADLDLRDLQIEDAEIDFGVGQLEARLPAESESNIVIDGGIGTITVFVPQGLGVRAVLDTGLATRNVPAAYARSGDVYTSPDYDRADTRTDLTISVGIGTVTIREVAPE